MQDCFQRHPEEYGKYDNEEEEEESGSGMVGEQKSTEQDLESSQEQSNLGHEATNNTDESSNVLVAS